MLFFIFVVCFYCLHACYLAYTPSPSTSSPILLHTFSLLYFLYVNNVLLYSIVCFVIICFLLSLLCMFSTIILYLFDFISFDCVSVLYDDISLFICLRYYSDFALTFSTSDFALTFLTSDFWLYLLVFTLHFLFFRETNCLVIFHFVVFSLMLLRTIYYLIYFLVCIIFLN